MTTETLDRKNWLLNAGIYFLIAGVFLWLCYPIMAFMWELWFESETHNNGVLIPLVSGYLVWGKRDQLRQWTITASWRGFIFLLFAALIFTAGIIGAERFTQEVSMVLLLIGVVWFNFGNRFCRAMAFPLLLLFLMIPPPHIFYNNLSVKLQLLSTKISMFFLHLIGVTVYSEGNIIYLPSMQLEVAAACSGIRSLFSLFTLGVIFAYIAQKRSSARLLLALSSIPIAILFNGLRISGTCILAQYWSPKITDSFNHFMSGWVVFIFAFAVMLLINKIIDKVLNYTQRHN
ncbi:MAG: exosortase A [bacterium]